MPKLVGSRARCSRRPGATCCSASTLGEIERRLNPPQDEEVPTFEHVVSTNGHGDLAAAAGIGSSA